MERRLREGCLERCSSSSRVAITAPQRECPSTTTSRVPNHSAANSTLPICAGDPDHEQVTQALVEDDLRRSTGIGTAEHDGKRPLLADNFTAPHRAGEGVVSAFARHEPTIAFPQALQGFEGRNHDQGLQSARQ
jgi:hypothetical protein